MEGRAAEVFALVGMAGELATEYGLTGWAEGDALNAAIEAFTAWREYRGIGPTRTCRFLDGIRDFLDVHGDGRSSGRSAGETVYGNRAVLLGGYRNRAGVPVQLRCTSGGRVGPLTCGASSTRWRPPGGWPTMTPVVAPSGTGSTAGCRRSTRSSHRRAVVASYADRLERAKRWGCRRLPRVTRLR
ncbi:MAG: hypothetical protein U5L11_11720 [Arhodomonas sp.]|nr:hypothetical protein [Arhodomonas sp.]